MWPNFFQLNQLRILVKSIAAFGYVANSPRLIWPESANPVRSPSYVETGRVAEGVAVSRHGEWPSLRRLVAVPRDPGASALRPIDQPISRRRSSIQFELRRNAKNQFVTLLFAAVFPFQMPTSRTLRSGGYSDRHQRCRRGIQRITATARTWPVRWGRGALYLGLVWLFVLPVQWADGALQEGFESPEPSWHMATADAQYRLDVHQRVRQDPHSGQWCEFIRLTGDNGSYVYMSCDVPRARVIAELTASLWLRADRPGLQLLARVVFPHTTDPSTGLPATVLVSGDSYMRVGVWQRLTLANLPLAVERQARVLRTTLGPQVDSREAFVDQLVLNAYGGPGVTNIWIDDLELSGVVERESIGSRQPEQQRSSGNSGDSVQRLPAMWEASDSIGGAGVPEVRMQANLLMVAGKPFFPRMVQYRGESMRLLKRLGFNTVCLPTLPTMDLIEEAGQQDLWLIAPPPASSELTTRNANGNLTRIGHDFDRVLAWDLGGPLTEVELDTIKPWVKALRAADPRRRPILCHPESDVRNYSRYADVLLVGRRPLGTSQELNEYGMWLRSRSRLARPGTPVWTTIATQPTSSMIEQLALLSNGQPPRLNWQHEQLRLLAITSLAAGMRGICFESLTPLDADDDATRQRAAILEWINLELALIEPWTAGGVYVTTAECTDPSLVGVVLQIDRARLLLPMAIASSNQFAIDNGPSGAVSFTVPGASESNNAFELSPAGLRPLAHRRVAGGLRVTLSDGDRTSPIVLTQDAVTTTMLSRRAVQLGRRMFELQRLISADRLRLAADIERRLTTLGHGLPQNAQLMAMARKLLTDSEVVATRNDLPMAEERTRQAMLSLSQLERAQWSQAALSVPSPMTSPFAVSFQTLPEFWQLAAMLNSAGRGPNRLTGGDCESLEAMLRAGWKHYRRPQGELASAVDLSGEGAHSGRYALRLRVTATNPAARPAIVETPPMWITTAPLLVESGELIEITGFVRVPEPITGSVDGLLIMDSLAGEVLAERVRTASDWQPFTLYRTAPQSGNLTLTFALTGIGEAWIDDVSVQVVSRGTASPQASRLPMAGATVSPRRR